MADGANYQGSHTFISHPPTHTHMHTYEMFKVIQGVTIPPNIASNMICKNLADARVHT